MVRLRLSRLGAKKSPSYRVIATDSRSPRDGRFIERLGFYNPMSDPPALDLKLDCIDYWLSKGAQPSDTVGQLITKARSAAPAGGAVQS